MVSDGDARLDADELAAGPSDADLGQNVVVVGAKRSGLVTDVTVGFERVDGVAHATPLQGWTLGEFYWVGVRGYANGVRDAGGR